MSAGVVAPIEVSKGGDVAAKVGNTLNVTTASATVIATDNATVLEVSQPRTEGSASFNGGALVVGEGSANLTVSGANGQLYVVKVTAEGRVPTVTPGKVG